MKQKKILSRRLDFAGYIIIGYKDILGLTIGHGAGDATRRIVFCLEI